MTHWCLQVDGINEFNSWDGRTYCQRLGVIGLEDLYLGAYWRWGVGE